MRNHSLIHDSSCSLIAICAAGFLEEMKSQAYAYSFTITDEGPFTLIDMYPDGLYGGGLKQ